MLGNYIPLYRFPFFSLFFYSAKQREMRLRLNFMTTDGSRSVCCGCTRVCRTCFSSHRSHTRNNSNLQGKVCTVFFFSHTVRWLLLSFPSRSLLLLIKTDSGSCFTRVNCKHVFFRSLCSCSPVAVRISAIRCLNFHSFTDYCLLVF